MTEVTPLVYCVVVSWNKRDMTLACLRALFLQNHPNFKVLLVDNNSSEDIVSAVTSTFPRCEVIRKEHNYGFAHSNNIGIQRALENGADYVFLLNNDAMISSDALSVLMETARRFPDAGVIGGRLDIRKDALPSHYNFYMRWRVRSIRVDQPVLPGWVKFVPGCGMLIRRGVFAKVGYFDDAFFAYGEDEHFCQRVLAAGYRIRYESSAVIDHWKCASTGGIGTDSRMKSYLYGRSYVRLLRLTPGVLSKVKLLVWVPAQMILTILTSFLRDDPYAAVARLKGMFEGLFCAMEEWPRFPRGVCLVDDAGLPSAQIFPRKSFK